MFNWRINYIIFSTFLLFFAAGCSNSEKITSDCFTLEKLKRLSLPRFEAHVINLKPDTILAPNISRVDIYTQITWNKIRFIKQGAKFEADYTLSYAIKKNDSLVTSKDVNKRPISETYEATQLSINDYNLQTFYLDSGSYKIQIQLTDNISGLSYKTQFNADARNFSVSTTLSNGLFLELKNGTLRPLFLNSIRFNDEFDTLVYFQDLYNVKTNSPIKIKSEFKTRESVLQIEEKSRPPYYADSSACLLSFEKLIFENERIIEPSNSQRIHLLDTFVVPIKQQFQFQRKIIFSNLLNKGKADTLVSSGILNINNKIYPQLFNLTDSIEATKYILFKFEIDSLLAQPTDLKKRSWLANWWQQHGGTSKKDEFYERAKDANLLFTSCDAGFRTPMGIVFMICGYPYSVDCQGSTNEIWQYVLNNAAFNFVFRKSNAINNEPFYYLQPLTYEENFWRYSIELWRRK